MPVVTELVVSGTQCTHSPCTMFLSFRTGKAGQLIIDDVDRVEGRSRGNLQSLNTKGNIYLGWYTSLWDFLSFQTVH